MGGVMDSGWEFEIGESSSNISLVRYLYAQKLFKKGMNLSPSAVS